MSYTLFNYFNFSILVKPEIGASICVYLCKKKKKKIFQYSYLYGYALNKSFGILCGFSRKDVVILYLSMWGVCTHAQQNAGFAAEIPISQGFWIEKEYLCCIFSKNDVYLVRRQSASCPAYVISKWIENGERRALTLCLPLTLRLPCNMHDKI